MQLVYQMSYPLPNGDWIYIWMLVIDHVRYDTLTEIAVILIATHLAVIGISFTKTLLKK